MVDWEFAAATARRLMRPGPQVTLEEATAVVSDLRMLAEEAEGHVGAFTRLEPRTEHAPIRVVDRPGWAEANLSGFSSLLVPVAERLTARRASPPSPLVTQIGSRVTGAQVGTVLAFLSGKVLGQYEVFSAAPGQLLLVAPNIVATERQLAVDSRDFRLWVCLHEVCHRTQFTAVPWLRDHFLAEVNAYVDAADLDPEALRERLERVANALVRAVRERDTDVNLIELVQTPEQQAVLSRLTALMTLVEGHAEYVMNGVGPEVVPTVDEIKRRFAARRQGTNPLDRAVRKLLGIDLKMRQYAEGATFVAAVVTEVGMDGFNAIWRSPNTLPTQAEISDPSAWVRRVHAKRFELGKGEKTGEGAGEDGTSGDGTGDTGGQDEPPTP
ncbi:MAG: zinc-dependent metalloprotease [Mycobacteriales bacterium]